MHPPGRGILRRQGFTAAGLPGTVYKVGVGGFDHSAVEYPILRWEAGEKFAKKTHMNNDWEIKSRAHACTLTGTPFSEGEFFHTLLYRERDGFRREDLCAAAWEARNENIRPFSFWRTKYEPPAPPKPEPLQKDDAEGLLRQMIASNDSRYLNAAYILALMLERKRILRPMPSEDPDVLVYEHAKTGEVFALGNPRLGIEQIPAVQREVAELLETGLGT